MRKKHVIAYWLIPAKPESELFASIIRILAKAFDAPLFEPHLTICAGPDQQTAAKTLRRIKKGPIRLRCRDIAVSSKFTKTLFVRFKSNPSVRNLCARLCGRPKALPDLHLSLIYKKLPAKTKRDLVATIKLPLRAVTFDRLKAVRCVSPTTTGTEVKNWRVLATKRLSE
jgi:cyclic phosphodiesterase-like protein